MTKKVIYKKALRVKSIHKPDHKYTADLLRKFRREAGLTQIQVADHFGMGQPWVSKVESGQIRLDFVQLKEITALYGKNVSDVIKKSFL